MIKKTKLWTTLALLATWSSYALNAQAEQSYAGWPDNWVAAYNRFENFIRQKQKDFPDVVLDIGANGTISHNIQFHDERGSDLSFIFLRKGTQLLETGLTKGRSDGIVGLPPGKYGLIIRSTGFLGFQSLPPITWVEIVESPDPRAKKTHTNAFEKRYKTISAPSKPEELWPNERLQYFFDFHTLPNRSPDEILTMNGKVNPTVRLWVDNSGTVTREKLPAELERLLHWRIYNNGRLIVRDSARDVTAKNLSQEPGTYQVLVGVEGLSGFMPVSNLLEFPLFPDGADCLAIYPSATKVPGFPDFLVEIIGQENALKILTQDPVSEGSKKLVSKGYDKATVYDLRNLLPDEPEKRELFILWRGWAWKLWRTFENPEKFSWKREIVPSNPSTHE